MPKLTNAQGSERPEGAKLVRQVLSESPSSCAVKAGANCERREKENFERKVAFSLVVY